MKIIGFSNKYLTNFNRNLYSGKNSNSFTTKLDCNFLLVMPITTLCITEGFGSGIS